MVASIHTGNPRTVFVGTRQSKVTVRTPSEDGGRQPRLCEVERVVDLTAKLFLGRGYPPAFRPLCVRRHKK
jgi:hypothetical protein